MIQSFNNWVQKTFYSQVNDQQKLDQTAEVAKKTLTVEEQNPNLPPGYVPPMDLSKIKVTKTSEELEKEFEDKGLAIRWIGHSVLFKKIFLIHTAPAQAFYKTGEYAVCHLDEATGRPTFVTGKEIKEYPCICNMLKNSFDSEAKELKKNYNEKKITKEDFEREMKGIDKYKKDQVFVIKPKDWIPNYPSYSNL